MASTVEHTILITAAGGNIGSELVPQLLKAPTKLVLPTSNASRLQSKLPSNATDSNVAVEEGKIQDPVWVQSILTKHNVDTVFLCLTGTDELLTTLNFFDAMNRAGCVKHLVYLSACADFVSEEGVKFLMRSCSAMHVVVKTTIEQKLAYAGFPWTTTKLGPTLFFTNDMRSKKSMLQDGVFDEPLGEKGVSRVSTTDIALAACNTLLHPDKWSGRKVMIGSLKRFTGSEVAALWSKALDREISILGADDEGLNKLEEHFTQMTGDRAWGRDLRLMYEIFREQGFGMSEEDYKLQVEVLGREPEDYEAWVRKTGESWR